MKRSLDTRTKASESLLVVTAVFDDQLTAMEKPYGPPTMDSGGVKSDGQVPATTGETIDNNPSQPTATASAPLYWNSGQTQSPA